ncbi:MAG: hypothetical protein VKN33_02195 [Candidatus Sericytochromatia bacterium]|nr:hypothetical protein [Candidatus Sericytochromatia bacterium]
MKWFVPFFLLIAFFSAPGTALALQASATSASPPLGEAKPALKRWEYKVTIYNRLTVFGDSDHEMRLLGLMGWELVSTTFDPHARTIVCFFKRPIGELPAQKQGPPSP